MAQPAFKPDDFDEADPAAFYLLGPGRADMERLADATLVVGGERLPAHSQMLSQHSGVLRGLFTACAGGQARVGVKRTADDEEGLVLEAPFEGSSLFDACLFLRFCYRPEERTPTNLAAAADSLAGLLRLAHKLDAPQIQQAVCAYMAGDLQVAATPRLLAYAAAADRCQLAELRASFVGEVAVRLFSGPSGQPGAAVETALVAEHCDRGVLAQVLEAMADMARRGVNPGGFEWALERYSEQPFAVGQAVWSPWFTAVGRQWRFQAYPGGWREEDAGHLSVFIECKQPGTRAKYSLTLVDKAEEGAQHIACIAKDPQVFVVGEARGFSKFATRHQRLRSRPGYLAGDRLVLRATVEMAP